MYVSHGKKFVNSIQFQYIDEDDGKLVLSPIFGCLDLVAPYFDTVTFTNPCEEYITRVSGLIGRKYLERGLNMLIIETNLATYGPFGTSDSVINDEDSKFSYWLGPDNQFGGFHGKSTSSHIASIGVYVRPVQHLANVSEISAHAHDDDQLTIS